MFLFEKEYSQNIRDEHAVRANPKMRKS